MENLNLTTEDIIFLTEIVNDIINNGLIDNRVSMHEFVPHQVAMLVCKCTCGVGAHMPAYYVCVYICY